MKKIVFGLQLDNKVPPIGMGEDSIYDFLGPQQFTIFLEKRFGIKPPDDNQVAIRTDVYRQHLATYLSGHSDAFFSKSFSADPFATAQTLLNLRDSLKQAGWKGSDNEEAPVRIRTLSLIEDDLNENIFWPKGWTDRQLEVLEKLPSKSIRNLLIYLVEPLDLFPVYWQKVLTGLENNGAKILEISSEPSSGEDSDLGQFQRFIHTQPSADMPKLKAKGDGSLCLFTGKRDTELAGWLAKWLNENKINKAFSELEQEFEREPSPEELATLLEIPTEEVETTLGVAARHVSMDAPFVEGEDNSLLDVLENAGTPGTDQELDYYESLRREIERSLSTLTDRQCDVIKLYFGIGVEHPMSLEDIGDKFGLTRERVRQIKDKAINKLRSANRSRLLKNYLGA